MECASLFEAIGGTTACHKLAMAFYGRVDADPVLRPFFPGKTHKCAIEAFSAYLTQLLGGPAEDTQRRWYLSLHESHLRFRISRQDRDAWMNTMRSALDDVPIQEPARSALLSLFERASAYLVNSETPPVVKGGGHPEIDRRWSAQISLDEAVSAIRSGASEKVISLANGIELKEYLKGHRSVWAALLAQMIRSGEPALLGYLRKTLAEEPALAQERYSGRTLLHAAAAAGDTRTVELLLKLGAEADAADDGGHTPLYAVANECETETGDDVVVALVQAGASVNACEGVKRCTALHMAARRNHVAVAKALLDCAANIEARDSLGETPLRRAVNCNQAAVAKLLVQSGADLHSLGSKGLTALKAARSAQMKAALQTRNV